MTYLLATTSAHYGYLCTCIPKERFVISSFSVRWRRRWLSPETWHLVFWYKSAGVSETILSSR